MRRITIILAFLLIGLFANSQDFSGAYYFGVPTLEINQINWYYNSGGGCSQITGGSSKNLNSKGSIITEYGFVASKTTTTPTLSDYQVKQPYTSILKNEESFSFASAGCNFGIGWWYIRLYAINCDGVGYSETAIELTPGASIFLPIVSTTSATNILISSVTSGGNVTDDGGATATERGVIIGTSIDPTITSYTQKIVDSGSGMGSFVSAISGLNKNTTYYIRAYAINSVGVGYGANVSFKTLQQLVPTLQTRYLANVAGTSAESGGIMLTDGNTSIIHKGVCWNTTGNPNAAYPNSFTDDGTGMSSFTSSLTGLTPGTKYYVRAYAENSYTGGGFTVYATGYGQEETFTTPSSGTLATVTTSSITSITQTTASGGGNVLSDGGLTVTSRGLCWSTSHNPTTSDSWIVSGSGTGSFTANMVSLNPGIIYYVRAYAINSSGTAYGNEISFTTANINITANLSGYTASPSYPVSIGGFWTITLSSPAPSTVNIPITITSGNNTGNTTINVTILSGDTTGENSVNYYLKTTDWTAYAIFGTMPSGYIAGTTANILIPAYNANVGDVLGGGIVAYIFQSGDAGYVSDVCHGIISGSSDISTSALWGCHGTDLAGASGTTIGSGLQNTIDIVSGCSTTGIAAKLCYDYCSGGSCDWFLPSKDEAAKLYLNRTAIGGFSTAYYSTSSEIDAYSAWEFNFATGTPVPGSNSKLIPLSVRPIRYF